jgi:hypothetical protein
MFYTCCESRRYPGLFLWRRNLSPRSHCRRLSFFDQPAPHPRPLPKERELVVGGATALTLAMVSRGESFDRAAVLLQLTPHPSPLPKERELVVTKTPPSKTPPSQEGETARRRRHEHAACARPSFYHSTFTDPTKKSALEEVQGEPFPGRMTCESRSSSQSRQNQSADPIPWG